jgi:hypothetical protein
MLNTTTRPQTDVAAHDYIDYLCLAAESMHQAALTPKQMVAAMCVIAAAYVDKKEDEDARI